MASQLKDVEELSSIVTRVLGQNPGPYTLQGTNTYLIGTKGSSAILLDAGEDKPAYVPLLKEALRSYSGISDIILSHYHHDHVFGLKSVLPLLQELNMGKPRIHKFPSEEKTGHDQSLLDILASALGTFEPANETSPLHSLKEGQTFDVQDASLKVLTTPGHTDDSASFLLSSTKETVLFTADTVLGQGTAVFTDLKALISSLEKCITTVEQSTGSSGDKVRLFCGHGPVVDDGVAKMREYIEHRMQREKQVLEALEKAVKPTKAMDLVKMIYGPELPEKLLLAAEHGIVLHLEKLEHEGKVKRVMQDREILWELMPRTTKV